MSSPSPRADAPDSGTAPIGSSSLGAGMKGRHLVMMGLGSAIGAGLFVGSGAGIHTAGPAVLLSYVIAGIVVIIMMRSLGELSAAHPSSGAFSVYTSRALGPAAGFTVLSATTIIATSPAEAAATVDITVTTPSGTSGTGSADHYTVSAATGPAVTGLSTTSGTQSGGTTVVLSGSGFTGTSAVSFGSVTAGWAWG